ncbi:glycine/D-amino acid oxidase-like deaminating enzyme [Pararhizobium capsulatum DSM 1112]|uniref:Glycine/D-amino acid oxidase-like deaminating enzyme n=1 Tax=Pararhizobium capsulatum DSM 1112 TaxID=1121113 RepID=A0ABU0C2B3_9HYPH|nr:FAD-binding oxidoreductase [Pararhizobium capsulatum]MDQ0323810.1 glycine/D-amino acid oxidase-like deaminating enzyme [Pararhizobium capsulatum DSM 1112]
MNTIKLRPPVVAAKADRSFWLQSIDADAVTSPLQGSADCDVAIVGGGYAGLWTALRIKEQAPQTRVTVLEADFCGSGASGRNGGQVHSWFAEIDMLRALVGEENALRLCRATVDAIEELSGLQASGTIDMDLRLDGWLWTASSTAQEGAWTQACDLCRDVGEERFRPLMRSDILRRTGSTASYVGIVEDRAGTVQPAKLALGLRRLALSKGIVIHEHSPVLEIVPGAQPQLRTAGGVLCAGKVVLAANAWLSAIPELHPYLYVVSSQVIATAPTADILERIGWVDGASICDAQHHVLYYQRTPAGQVIFGRGTGGIAYRDRIDGRFNRSGDAGADNIRELHRVYPQLKEVPVLYDWSGPIDCTAQHLPIFGHLKDHANIFYAMGFNGTGIAQAPVAGRIMASLVLGRDDVWSRSGLVGIGKRTRLPPEPLRYVGAKVVRQAIRRKNDLEILNREPDPLTRFLARLAP